MNNKWHPCTYRLSAKGVIVIDDKLLMVIESDDDGWDLPGGGIEHGETLSEGFKREIKEETSLDITDHDASPAILHIIQSRWDNKPHGVWAAFRCTASGNPQATASDVTIKMVTESEFKTISLFSPIQELREQIREIAWPNAGSIKK